MRLSGFICGELFAALRALEDVTWLKDPFEYSAPVHMKGFDVHTPRLGLQLHHTAFMRTPEHAIRQLEVRFS